MLNFGTDAPAMVLRHMVALEMGASFTDAPSDSALWVENVVTIREDRAYNFLVGMREGGFRVERWGKARPAIGDPTASIAIARISRSEDPASGAPVAPVAR